MNVYLVAATILIAALVPCLVVAVRGSIIEAVVALELGGALTTLTLVCLAEGFQRQVYFSVATVCAVTTWAGGLVVVRFVGRLR